jgi:hypothetical protein
LFPAGLTLTAEEEVGTRGPAWLILLPTPYSEAVVEVPAAVGSSGGPRALLLLPNIPLRRLSLSHKKKPFFLTRRRRTAAAAMERRRLLPD